MPANPYKVGVNLFNQVGSDWICWGPDGKELTLPDGSPAHFKIGREAREFLNALRGDKKAAAAQRSSVPGKRVGKDEIHPDYIEALRNKKQVDEIITHLVGCRWRKLGNVDDDDSARMTSPDGTRVYVYVGNRKLDRYFCWAAEADGAKIKGFDFMAVKPFEEKTVEETVAELGAPAETTENIEIGKQDEAI